MMIYCICEYCFVFLNANVVDGLQGGEDIFDEPVSSDSSVKIMYYCNCSVLHRVMF